MISCFTVKLCSIIVKFMKYLKCKKESNIYWNQAYSTTKILDCVKDAAHDICTRYMFVVPETDLQSGTFTS